MSPVHDGHTGRWSAPLRVAAVFLALFAPVLNVGLGAYGDTLALLCVVWAAWYAITARTTAVIFPRELQALVALLVATLAYALAAGLVFSSDPSSLQTTVRPARALITVLGVGALALMYARGAGAESGRLIVRDIFWAITLHATLMVVQFVVPAVRDVIYPYTFADQALEYNQQFRMAGLTNGGGAQLSMFQAFGLLAWPFLLAESKSILRRVLLGACAALIVASLILSGRSGIVLAFVGLPPAFFVAFRQSGTACSFPRAATELAIMVTGATLLAVAYVGFSSLENFTYLETAVFRSLDFILGDRGLTDRDDAREFFGEHFFLPTDARTLLFGDSRLFEAFYQGVYRIVDSDSGYVNFLFGYGIVGSLLQYAFYALTGWFALRSWRVNPPLAFLGALWASAMLALHVKEVLVFTRVGLSITVLLAASLAAERIRPRSYEVRPC